MSDTPSVANPLGQVDVVQHDMSMHQREVLQQQMVQVKDGPVPMSMPAILRNPRVSQAAPVARQTRDGYARCSTDVARSIGKRRARRNENGLFTLGLPCKAGLHPIHTLYDLAQRTT